MTSHRWLVAPLLLVWGVVVACSSSSSGSGGDAGGGGSSSGGSSGSSSGGSGNGVCVVADDGGPPFECLISKQPALSASQVAQICTMEGGRVASSCPTANLVGCCTQLDLESCYYTGALDASASQQQSTCTGSSPPGTWSTTP